MSLNDDIVAALPFLRAQAESMMVDTVSVGRATGETTIDPDSLAEVPVFDEVYSGAARIQRSGQLSPSDDVLGGFEFGVNAVIVQLPLSASGILPNDRVTVTGVAAISDPDVDGLVATVQANLTKTHPTKRTLVCEEVG